MAAVEFALLLPFMILIIVAAMVLGHAMFVRSRLLSYAFFSARSCAVEMERNDQSPDCQSNAQEHFQKVFDSDCSPGPDVQVSLDEDVSGLQYVKGVLITVKCKYSNGWLDLLEQRLGGPLKFGNFEVSTLVPYSVRSAEEALIEQGS